MVLNVLDIYLGEVSQDLLNPSINLFFERPQKDLPGFLIPEAYWACLKAHEWLLLFIMPLTAILCIKSNTPANDLYQPKIRVFKKI